MASEKVLTIKSENFEELVLKSSVPVLVDFGPIGAVPAELSVLLLMNLLMNLTDALK